MDKQNPSQGWVRENGKNGQQTKTLKGKKFKWKGKNLSRFEVIVGYYGFDWLKKIQNCSHQLWFYDMEFYMAKAH